MEPAVMGARPTVLASASSCRRRWSRWGYQLSGLNLETQALENFDFGRQTACSRQAATLALTRVKGVHWAGRLAFSLMR